MRRARSSSSPTVCPSTTASAPDTAPASGGAAPAAWPARCTRSCSRPRPPGSAGPAAPGRRPPLPDIDGVRHARRAADAEDDCADHYEGFANATLWPLYHDAVEQPVYHRGWWEAYQRVNRRFAEAAAEVAEPGAVVWVQDYHLQLVPGLLRELRPDLRIGFFLHVPFPPPELFMQLPRRAELLRGMLGADLVGFQRAAGRAQLRPARRQAARLRGHRPADRGRRPGGADRRVPGLDRHRRDGARWPPARTWSPAARRLRADLGEPATGAAQRRPAGLHQGHRAAAQGVQRAARDGPGQGRATR